MVALGCKYLRICHLNNCATGVATQHQVLRSRYFIGLPEMVVNYFRFVAAEVREILASLGARSLGEIIGRTDCLQVLAGTTAKQHKLDLEPLLSMAGVRSDAPQFCNTERNSPFDRGELAERMVRDMLPAIASRSGGEWSYAICNYHRSIGARLSGEIARHWGNYGMENAPIRVRCSGHAGQSFGVWNAGGLHLYLEGDANDYVGKGMAAGRIVLRHPRAARFVARDTIIMGNTCLYGATGGELYAAGVAGERFAVRNSGAVAVIEGAGDHCCEYMTGGTVAVLGDVGLNAGAGMTGGELYVYDVAGRLPLRLNTQLVVANRGAGEALRGLLELHLRHTGSTRAAELLERWDETASLFWHVQPRTDVAVPEPVEAAV
jgi:glutamate synthase (NADPH/NADH) large chain